MARMKITAAVRRRILTLRDRGVKIADIAAKVGFSVGAVHGVVTAPSPVLAAPSEPPSAPSASAVELPAHEDIRRWLGEQIEALRADCARYRKAGNATALAAANRNLNAATAALARVTPEPTTRDEGTFLWRIDEAKKAQDEGWRRLTTLMHGTLTERSTWRRCHACGQSIPEVNQAALEKAEQT